MKLTQEQLDTTFPFGAWFWITEDPIEDGTSDADEAFAAPFVLIDKDDVVWFWVIEGPMVTRKVLAWREVEGLLVADVPPYVDEDGPVSEELHFVFRPITETEPEAGFAKDPFEVDNRNRLEATFA